MAHGHTFAVEHTGHANSYSSAEAEDNTSGMGKDHIRLSCSKHRFFLCSARRCIMLYFDIIKAEFWPIVISTAISTVIVLAVTGWVHQIYGKAVNRKGGDQ